MRRYLEMLFSHKALFFVPLLAVPLIALAVMYYAGRDYEVTATVWVQPNSYLGNSGTGTTAARGTTSVPSPNQLEAQAIAERLQTESFRMEAMDRVGLSDAIQLGHWPVPTTFERSMPAIADTPVLRNVLQMFGWVRPSTIEQAQRQGLEMFLRTITVAPEGNNLIRITYVGKEPFLGKRLIEESITLYNEKTQALYADLARSSIEFYASQAELEKQRLDQASAVLQQFLETHPEPLLGQSRPAAEAAQLSNLETSHRLELSLYESALRDLERVRVEAEAKASPRTQIFNVVDAPQEPTTASLATGAATMAIIFGLILGGIIGLVPILLMTWQDTTVRTISDVQSAVPAPLYARAPRVPSGDGLRKSLARRLAQQ